MNRLIAFFGMVVSCTALLSPIGVLAKAIDTPHRPARLVPDWKVLTNTYWMVYPQNLPAFELQGNSIGTLGLPKTDPPTVSPLQDQTVYYIKGYDRSGYFWGTFATEITDPSWDDGAHVQSECGALLSPITPLGDIIISTTSDQGSNGQPPTQNWGTGKMVWMNVDGKDQWTMQNYKADGYVHWAYMVQVKPGHRYWNDLPFSNKSVPDFLAPCYQNPDKDPLKTNNWNLVNPPANPPMP